MQALDVERHVAYYVSRGGVLVPAKIMEKLGAGVGCVLSCSDLLLSGGVEGHQDADVECTCVLQEDS